MPGEKNMRVKRRTIGIVDTVNPKRMFPNEAYFELFPENEVPAEIRDEFLRDCAFRRVLRGIRNGGRGFVESAAGGQNRGTVLQFRVRGTDKTTQRFTAFIHHWRRRAKRPVTHQTLKRSSS